MGLGSDGDESIVRRRPAPEQVEQPLFGLGHGSGAARASGMVRQWTPPPQRTNWSISTSIRSWPRRRSNRLIRLSRRPGATIRQPPRLSRLASSRSTSSGRRRKQLDAEPGHRPGEPGFKGVQARHGAMPRDQAELGVEVKVARVDPCVERPPAAPLEDPAERPGAGLVGALSGNADHDQARPKQADVAALHPPFADGAERRDAETAQRSGQMRRLAAPVRLRRAQLDEAPGGHEHGVAGEGEVRQARLRRDEVAIDPRRLELRHQSAVLRPGARGAGGEAPGEAVAGHGVARHHREVRGRAQQDVGRAGPFPNRRPSGRARALGAGFESRRLPRRAGRCDHHQSSAPVALEAARAAMQPDQRALGDGARPGADPPRPAAAAPRGSRPRYA